MKLTAQEVYDRLLNDDKILTLKGQISFKLGDISIIVKQRDVVGNIMQEWMEGWFKKNGVAYAINDNTQMPPDFFLDPMDKRHHLLEIKAFNYKAGPGFDIADFKMYEQEIVREPWMLDVTYLMFGYEMSDEGVGTSKKLWSKKVWEITRPMYSGKTPWPINLQIKKKVVNKIRPAKWYTQSKQFNLFDSLEDFLSAIEETVYQNTATREEGPDWKHAMIESYHKFYGKRLEIPRWSDIRGKYYLKEQKG